MPATSGQREKLVHCDVSELKNVPDYDGEWIALIGTAGQCSFGASIREKKLLEWRPDLPENIANALCGISDSTWWIANQHKDSSDIGWPQSWVAVEEPRQPDLLSQPSTLKDSRSKVIAAAPAANGKPIPSEEIEKFDAFAKMACRSPEMSYMTMMALLYRQTKDPRVLQLYRAARDKVDGYIDGIEKILGIPK